MRRLGLDPISEEPGTGTGILMGLAAKLCVGSRVDLIGTPAQHLENARFDLTDASIRTGYKTGTTFPGKVAMATIAGTCGLVVDLIEMLPELLTAAAVAALRASQRYGQD